MKPFKPHKDTKTVQPLAIDAATLEDATRTLLDARTGHAWQGELSSSALATATAIFALTLCRQARIAREGATDDDVLPLIRRGVAWLVNHQNADGGWGDTTKSLSNISTTALCWAALSAIGTPAARGDARQPSPARRPPSTPITAAQAWLRRTAGSLEPHSLAAAIAARYGNDRTFSVPILTTLALAGCLGPQRDAWRHVPQLPFQLAALPQRWFRRLRLQVVSYALPALIAIGLVRHRKRPSRNPITRALRSLVAQKALRVLERIQPASGGFLEATPLTSFVLMSLVGAGLADHPVARRGARFLIRSARPDGSWPIDTNLATWLTTLAVNALGGACDEPAPQHLAAGPARCAPAVSRPASGPAEWRIDAALTDADRRAIRNWLLAQQHREPHPYTGAAPGGWAWTDLPGGVPDADDTAGTLLALRHLGPIDDEARRAAELAIRWLLDLQNRDGGIPTFCRGWGKLPFDRSSPDLTAHAVRAWAAWRHDMPNALRRRIDHANSRATDYLVHSQRPDGAWSPLWFGNQHEPNEENLTYGTSRVLRAAEVTRMVAGTFDLWVRCIRRAGRWLLATQNPDGGWGGGPGTPSSVEETAWAIDALAGVFGGNVLVGPDCDLEDPPTPLVEYLGRERVEAAITRGLAWLGENTDRGRRFEAAPIGFYFAKLWYYERLYPLIFTCSALLRVSLCVADCRSGADGTEPRAAVPQD